MPLLKIKTMNKVDEVYLDLLKDILENGVEKETRSGLVKSLFGRQLRFDLKEGFPLLTTKKVFTKGIIHELLWFLQRPMNSHGNMNIEYLVRNGVHIWDDDAYRWFKTKIINDFSKNPSRNEFLVCVNDDERSPHSKPILEYWIENERRHRDIEWLKNITKEEFIDLTLQRVEIHGAYMSVYRFGDLGEIYGKQWRSFGKNGVDQIKNIINTLKTNPNDRRMLCIAYNPDALENMALPPCHVMFQFYTRELSEQERMKEFNRRYAQNEIPQEWFDWFREFSKGTERNKDVELPRDSISYDVAGIPKYGLSCMYTMRSNDEFLGQPFNTPQYSLLTCMIAKLVNMIPDELIASIGDCHIYEAHYDAVNEQLSRNGSDVNPKLIIHGNQNSIEDFKFEDFEIKGYYPNPPIKAPLLVGL
jgi:thymidylate synthase